MNKISVVIVDDHALIREAWALILSDEKFDVILSTGDGEQAVTTIRDQKPDLVLLDINMTPLDGFAILEMVRTLSPKTKVIAVSAHSQPVYARKMLRAGASGYITKNSNRKEFLFGITEVMEGRKYVCNEVKTLLSEEILDDSKKDAAQINDLTEKELEIIQYIKQGLSSKEIAGKMNIVKKTVEVHRHRIFKKLKVKNVVSLVQLANQYGI
jgi:two-component system, NarL family, invasion response regulator UvrY